jgi:hypothetical protein
MIVNGLLVAILAGVPATNDVPAAAEKSCDVRSAGHARLEQKDHTFVDVPIPESRYITDDAVTLYPDESFAVSGTVEASVISQLRIRNGDTGAAGIAFSFKQTELESGKVMLLTVANPYSAYLKYRAVIQRPDGDLESTSICEVPPGISAIEVWPFPIARVILNKFTLLSAEGKTSAICE